MDSITTPQVLLNASQIMDLKPKTIKTEHHQWPGHKDWTITITFTCIETIHAF